MLYFSPLHTGRKDISHIGQKGETTSNILTMTDNYGTPFCMKALTYNRPYAYNKIFNNNRQQTTPNTTHMLEVQDKVSDTLHNVQHQSTTDRYVNDLKTCNGNNTEEFSSCLINTDKLKP